MLRHFHLHTLCLAGLLAACAPGSKSPINNPNLERWCDDHPCGWDVEGEAKRVGTWHPDDYAIELVGDDSAVSQVRPELNATLATCFAFSLMAHVAKDARALLELDFLDDGEVEFSERIPTSDWDVHTFEITTPTWYEGVRFRVRKDGPGEVIVAELNVHLAEMGCPATPLALNNRPAGAKCKSAEECASGSCSMPELSIGGSCD
ncbi:MAG TPA: hypothetical protein VFG30_21640 [Polyangiales bacterium]|nr:hypothetical protein [Polyangiales bacterium]